MKIFMAVGFSETYEWKMVTPDVAADLKTRKKWTAIDDFHSEKNTRTNRVSEWQSGHGNSDLETCLKKSAVQVRGEEEGPAPQVVWFQMVKNSNRYVSRSGAPSSWSEQETRSPSLRPIRLLDPWAWTQCCWTGMARKGEPHRRGKRRPTSGSNTGPFLMKSRGWGRGWGGRTVRITWHSKTNSNWFGDFGWIWIPRVFQNPAQ